MFYPYVMQRLNLKLSVPPGMGWRRGAGERHYNVYSPETLKELLAPEFSQRVRFMRIDAGENLPLAHLFEGQDKRPVYTWNGNELVFHHFDEEVVRTCVLPVEKEKYREIDNLFNPLPLNAPEAVSESARSELNALTALRFHTEPSHSAWLMHVDADNASTLLETSNLRDNNPVYTWNGSELVCYHIEDGAARRYLLPVEKVNLKSLDSLFNRLLLNELQPISEDGRSLLHAFTALWSSSELWPLMRLMRVDAGRDVSVSESFQGLDKSPVYTWNGKELVFHHFDDEAVRTYVLPVEKEKYGEIDTYFNRLPLNALEAVSESAKNHLNALTALRFRTELSRSAWLMRVDADNGSLLLEALNLQDTNPVYTWNGSELVCYLPEDGAVRSYLLPVEKDNRKNLDRLFNRLPLNELQPVSEDGRRQLQAFSALWNRSELWPHARLMRIDVGEDVSLSEFFQDESSIYTWNGSVLRLHTLDDGAVRTHLLPVNKDNLNSLDSLFNPLPLNEPQTVSDETLNQLKLLSSRQFRFVVDKRGDVWFAPEGAPDATIPGHGHMLEGENCLTAGNVFVSADGRELLGVSNKSGDYKPSVSSLFWLFRNLFLHPTTFPFMIPSRLFILESSGLIHENVVMSVLRVAVSWKCAELSTSYETGMQGPEVKTVIVRGSDNKRSQHPMESSSSDLNAKRFRTVNFFDCRDASPEIMELPQRESAAPAMPRSRRFLFADMKEESPAASSSQVFPTALSVEDDSPEIAGLPSHESATPPMPRSRRSLFADMKGESPAASSSQDFSL